MELLGSDIVVCLEELLLLTFIYTIVFSICNVSFVQYSVLQTFRKHRTLNFMANYSKIILFLLTRSGSTF
ncbi:hypothetical protein BT93_B2765 [Corymbia citriodora subsp. variegata]|nr:hypothetical protein BT93_B2765 [Corymbia citriodora subsp. variegata]